MRIEDARIGIRLATGKRSTDWLGWRPDVPKKSDYRYLSIIQGVPEGKLELSALPTVEAFPATASARNLTRMALFDQGPRGSCTGQATANMHGIIRDVTPRSAMYAYAEARKKINELDQDAGAYLRDAMAVACELGVPRDDLWPDTQENLFVDPAPKADTDALARRVAQYYRLETREDILHCIAQGFPFAFGVSVFDSFFDVGAHGYTPYPDYDHERWYGGHACFGYRYHLNFRNTPEGQSFLAMGIDVEEEVVRCRNSWGSWGYQGKGDFFIPIRYLVDKDLCDDLWTLRRTV